MEQAAGEARRPHILAIPYPLVGHMTPVVQLCRMLIALARCRVTIACCERDVPRLRRLLKEGALHMHMAVLPISDGLPVELGPFTWDTFRRVMPSRQEGLARGFAPHIPAFARDDGLVCVISDVYLSWTQDVADQLGVPRLAVWAAAAAEYQVYFHAKELINTGTLPFKAPRGSERGVDNMLPNLLGRPPRYHRIEGAAEEEEEIKLHGLPALKRRDFPTFLQIEDASDVLFHTLIEHVSTGLRASMLLFNSFQALEGTVLDAIRSQGVPAHCMGPLFLLEDAVLNEHVPASENGNGSREYDELLEWLDGQRPTSVLYVAFGTLIHLAEAQVRELALGLLESGQAFVWVYPTVPGAGRLELPEGFVEGRGRVVEWAPQKRVLRHPSIGGFLSHCGWNSSMETMCCGVPILGLPFVSDEPLNCKMMVDEWKVGLRLPRSPGAGVAVAADIARLTKALLCDESGRVLRERAQELGLAAEASIKPGGASRLILDAIVELLIH